MKKNDKLKKSVQELIDHMKEITQREKEEEYDNSYGTAILKNGMVIPIYSKFKMFRDGFVLYSNALVSDDEKKAKEIISGLNNGILSNGAVTLDITDVSGFVSADKRDYFPNRDIPLDDLIGDSFLSN